MFKRFIDAFINKYFHRCEYKIIGTSRVYDLYCRKGDLPIAVDYVLQCKVCGNVIKKRI